MDSILQNTSTNKFNWKPQLASLPAAPPSQVGKPASLPTSLHGTLRELFARTGTDALAVGVMSWPAEDDAPLDPCVAEVVEELAGKLAEVLKPEEIAKKATPAAFAVLAEWRASALQYRDDLVSSGRFGPAGPLTNQIAAISEPLTMSFANAVCAIVEKTENLLSASSPSA